MADLILERTVPASVTQVWAAVTDPRLMTRWYCPNPDLPTTVDQDLRVGGAYRIAMGPHVVEGTYSVLQPPSVAQFSWSWVEFLGAESAVRFELTATPDGTHLRLTQSGLADAQDVANHEQGWTGSLTRLQALLATPPATDQPRDAS